jgi:hypothetical protein
MTEETKSEEKEVEKKKKCCHHASRNASCTGGGAVYGLGFIGAAVYFIQHADGFSAGVVGFLKAIVWPAFVIYRLLAFLGL